MSRFEPGALVSGKYRIVRLIGDGGMGVVYEARHEVLGSSVALKFLHADLAKRPGLTQRFMQEARVSATIQSPHVTHVTDVDTAQDGSPYLVMELLSGQSLQGMLDRQGKLLPDQSLDFALQILSGLEAAHALGVVHRDMKPDNVFVTPSGGGPLLKLIDFGIAKLRASSEYTKGLTRAGVMMGTPEYMAPEQLVSAQTTDHRADIYSLGVMLFEMLSGLRPADGDDAEIIVAAVEAGRVRNIRQLVAGIPEGLALLIERATAPNREARFESAAQMRLELAQFAGHLSHAGRLAATAEPLAVLPTPASSILMSLPASVVPPPAVPKTLPPDGPPLSVSQLGAARTSLSERPLTPGTELGAPAFGGPAPYAAAPQYSTPNNYSASNNRPARGRSSLLIVALVLAVLIGGGAVGYAAYRAADDKRNPIPPLPDTSVPVPTGTLSIAPLNPDVKPEGPFASGGTGSTVPTKDPGPSTTKPTTGAGAGGASSTPPSTGTGGAPGFTIPFPIPSTIQIPTTLPSITLPPGFSFPPGFPGVQQPPASTGAPAGTTPPTGTTPPSTPTAAPTGTTPKKTTTRP